MKTTFTQRGLSLLEMIFVIGLAATATVLAFQDKKIEMEQMQARTAGGALFEYNNAVRAWLAQNPDPSPVTYSGSAWLKSTSCGGLLAVAYLPCTFSDATVASPITYGRLSLQTIIEKSGVGAAQRVKATTITTPYMNRGGQARSDLSGLATIVAAAGSTQSSTPVLMSTDGSYKSDPFTAAITMVASNNASNDIWLRTDGSNTMNNNLRFKPENGGNLREIQNVSRIQNIALSALYLGNSGGALSGNSVIVEADQGLLGAMTISNQRGLADAVTVQRGNLRLQAGGITASGAISSGGSMTASGTISSGGAISSGGDISANGRVIGQSSVESRSDMKAPIFYDSNNTSYYVDPDATSVLNNLVVRNRAEVGEYLLIQGVVVQGWGCSANGLLARDSSGKSMSCVNGIWNGSSPSGDISYSTFQMGYDGTRDLGSQTFCAIGTYRSDSEDDGLCQVYKSGTNWFITTSQQSWVGCAAVCINM